MLDLITLCVESGLNLTDAIRQVVDKGPAGVLKDEFARQLRDVRGPPARRGAARDGREHGHAAGVEFRRHVAAAIRNARPLPGGYMA